ncbi:DUF1846 domain-containing protein [Fusobacterium sp. PH5-44]|uniref:DUF1846 domain-containing protein n=1 Tax=unclassified Fusobacterium TaxID=2648384 RepID=UPI003D1E08F2
MQIGFDNEKYLEEQSKYILEKVRSHHKLYLEFGGKLMFDLHAKRVLPGFDENAKIKLLQQLKENVEVIICVYAGDISRNKIQGDFGITYDMEVSRMIDNLREYNLEVNSVVITRYEKQDSTGVFINKLERRGIKVYKHKATKGYPMDIDTIVSDEGYGKNPYIVTTKSIVVVTAPGPGSGKLATCLSQLYHDYKQGQNSWYAKFETFPVWNFPLKHPLNIAYEAATVDLKDVNMIDPFHLEAYGETAVNYNRDIEAFPLLKRIIEKITGKESVYQSPTDMGVNRVAFGVIDDEVVRKASEQEIIRRYFKTACEYKKGYIDQDTLQSTIFLMKSLELREEDRPVVIGARKKLEKIKKETKNKNELSSAIALDINGTIITGKHSEIMNSSAAAILNAVKFLANINDEILLISPVILKPILNLKNNILESKSLALDCEEILLALSICAATNPVAQVAMEKLQLLKGVQAHATHIIGKNDEQTLRKLGIDITCDPEFPTENLYYNE